MTRLIGAMEEKEKVIIIFIIGIAYAILIKLTQSQFIWNVDKCKISVHKGIIFKIFKVSKRDSRLAWRRSR